MPDSGRLAGYLEASGALVLLRDVEWVEISTCLIKGGIALQPRRFVDIRFVDIKGEILAYLNGTPLTWELRESTWSKEGMFENQPVQVIRFVNPFGPESRSESVVL